jgi:hypothetical protein
MLGQTCEKIGEWKRAIRAYTQYLSTPDMTQDLPGFPNAYSYARQLVDFYNSPNWNWTFDSLSSLVRTVKTALDTGNAHMLEGCRAKVNFFARTW